VETCLVEMLIMQVNAEYFPLPPSSASEMAYIVSVGALNYSLTLPPSVDPDVVPPPRNNPACRRRVQFKRGHIHGILDVFSLAGAWFAVLCE